MASTGPGLNLSSATITSFEDDAKAREIVTRTDDNGVVQFVPTKILRADGTQLSNLSIDSLLGLLLETCSNAVPPEGANVGLVTALLAANEGGGDAAEKDLRKQRAIISQAFEFLVTSTTMFGILRSGMRRAKLGEATYLLLPSSFQMASPYTPPPMMTTPPIISTLGKHGRESETGSDAGNRGEDGGAASTQADGGETFSQTGGLRTDFDIPKQVRFPIYTYAQHMINCTTLNKWQSIPCEYNYTQRVHHRRHSASAQLCHKKQYCNVVRYDHTRNCVCRDNQMPSTYTF